MADFFETLFAPFDPSGVQQGAQLARESLLGTSGTAQDIYDWTRTKGLEALGGAAGAYATGYPAAQGYITGYLPQATGALYGGSEEAARALNAAQAGAIPYLTGYGGMAAGAFDPLAAAGERYGAAWTPANAAYMESLLGAPGGARYGAFEASPYYNFMRDEAVNAAARGANVGGMAAGGNVLDEIARRVQGMSGQEFRNWQDQLFRQSQLFAPLEERALAGAATGRAGAYGTTGRDIASLIGTTGSRLADLYAGTGRTGAELYMGAGRTLADLESARARGLASVYGSEADYLRALAGGQTGALGQYAGPIAGTYGTEYGAPAQAGANIWDVILGAGKVAASAAAGGGGRGTPLTNPNMRWT